MIDVREIRHFHLFSGLGGGAKGFNKAQPRVGNMVGRYRCIGGVDVDAGALRDFERLTGMRGTVLDLFDRDQYIAFNGHEPPADWREATPADIRAAAGGEYPHIVFLSAPCKGFSGLMSETRSRTDRYQALNRLTERGIWLMLEAFADDPPELVVFENVPRIMHRGRQLLDRIDSMLHAYTYATAETTHDCGRLGNLAQSRKRYLKVARHTGKVRPFVYEPHQRPLRAVGDILGRMPLPGDPAGGPMHRIPRLSWKTWVRLAFVEAGSDWRSLNRLAVEDGYLRDYLIVPGHHNGWLGVRKWEEPSGTVAGGSLPGNGSFSVADPRAPVGAPQYQQYGVNRWADWMGAVINVKSPGQGTFCVADPRHSGTANSGGQRVADPRPDWNRHSNNYKVVSFDRPSGTVIAGGKGVQGGRLSVADPRPNIQRGKGDHYLTAGHYGVVPWESASGAVSSAAGHDNGRWSVADPRPQSAPQNIPENIPALPQATDKLVAVIRSLDDTWHRPFTTLELAALQSLIDPEEYLELDGLSDSAWRERIGNAVPPDAAEAIAEEFGRTLLLAWSGETFALSATPIWVRPVAVALSVAQGGEA